MARIRSTHPGQWTDEDFVTCSPIARLLCIALRNEADDKGVFEWKPITLKMRLLPADSADVSELLEELIAAKQVKRFEFDGSSYGAIRNFRKYQRPKKPNDVFPLPNEYRTYVGLSIDNSELVGKTPEQMEEGGGKVEEVKKDSCSVQADANFEIHDKDQNPSFAEPPFQPKPEAAKALVDEADKGGDEDLLKIPDYLLRPQPEQLPPGKFPTLKALGSGPARKYPAEFERFWATYPQRHTDTKAKAYIAWLKGVKAVGVDILQTGAEAYANYCAAKDHPSKLVSTWVSDEGWTADYGAAGGGNGGEAQTPYQSALSAWYADDEAAKGRGDTPPPKPRREDFVS